MHIRLLQCYVHIAHARRLYPVTVARSVDCMFRCLIHTNFKASWPDFFAFPPLRRTTRLQDPGEWRL